MAMINHWFLHVPVYLLRWHFVQNDIWILWGVVPYDKRQHICFTWDIIKCAFSLLHPVLATGVIVLTSCVCVCLLPLSCLNGQTYKPEFRYVGQVEGYLGQVRRSRSKVKVTRSKNVLRYFSIMAFVEQWGSKKWILHCSSEEARTHSTPYMNGGATTRGVSKRICVFFFCILFLLSHFLAYKWRCNWPAVMHCCLSSCL